MAIGWMKSLQCKSKASDDVVHHQSNPKIHHHIHSCRSLKDAVETTTKPKPVKPSKTPQHQKIVSRKPEPASDDLQPQTGADPCFGELPKGHPSRNVVEIIFHTSWGEKKFPGRVDMVLKIQNSTRTLNRFEEYREVVKCRSSYATAGDGSEDHARCVADGNEMMRFYCLGDTTAGGAYESGRGAWAFHEARRAGVCTFSGSGVAHENGGGGRGRRAMLVCRVIAGRVFKRLKFDSVVQGETGYDSVGGGNGELLVFNMRAVLPCFLIIYQL